MNPINFFKIVLSVKNWPFLFDYLVGLEAMVSHKYYKAGIYFDKCLSSKRLIDSGLKGLIYEQLGKCYFDTNLIIKGKDFLLESLRLQNLENDAINSEISSRLGFIFFQEEDYGKAKYYLELAKKKYKKIDYTNIKAVKDHLLKIEANKNNEE